MSKGFELSVVAARPALVTGRENIIEVLVRGQAPDAPTSGLPERPRLNLAVVIDRSGSMSGQPLHEAKRCAAFIVDSLKATDRASVIAYDNSVQVLAESQTITSKEHLKARIAQIHEGGNTNLHGGWLKGAEEAAKHLAPDCVSRVLLLSDGNANDGVTGVDEIASQCAQLASTGVTTSTYGLGHSFNEELMVAMSRSGRGNGYYSETAESLMERFREEFSLLASLCARDVRLRLSLLPGVDCEMLNTYAAAQDGSWRLPDLAYDGEAWAALRLRVNAASVPAAGENLALLQASIVYRDLDGVECELPATWLSLPVMTQDEFHAVPEDASVIRRVKEAAAAKLQESASRAAKQHDWNQVDDLLAQARKLATDNPWLNSIVAYLEHLASERNTELFSKECSYAASGLSAKLRSKKEFASDFDESAAASYLRRKVRQGGSGHYGQLSSPKTYQLDIFDNHPLALIDGKRVLLDTGSPFSIGDSSRFGILGREFSFGEQMGVTPAKLSQWMNTEIHVLLGTDVLSKFGFLLDWWAGEVTFAPGSIPLPREATPLPIDLIMGTPALRFRAPQGMVSGLFDTGAKICYFPKESSQGLTPVGHTHDFHVLTGTYETDIYELALDAAGHRFTARFGVLPTQLSSLLSGATGIDWVIGTDLLRQGRVFFELARKRIAVLWQPTQDM